MNAEKHIFTTIPVVAIVIGLLGLFLGYNWLALVASLFCLPVLFYRFVVETNFLFAFTALPLTIVGAFVYESWLGGAALWFIGWSLASLVHSYAKYTPIKRKHKQKIAEYKQSPEFKEAVEHAKSAYNFDLSALSCESAILEFKKADTPIDEPITKFGGQPVWIQEPQWPVSKFSGKPMQFIGQVAIDKKLYGAKKARIAYIFYADEETETWDMDSGENAIILQPGETEILCLPLNEGPSLTCSDKGLCEYSVELEYSIDSQFIPEYEQGAWSEKELKKYTIANYKTKLGGTPHFHQPDEFPAPGKWSLLFQIKEADFPLNVNFGLGCAYAFINSEGTIAKFLWQQ